jgi:putative endonuclease
LFYTYLLKSELNGRYYIGACADPELRLLEHNRGQTRSTSPYRPWRLVWQESFGTRNEALKRERYLKSLKSRAALESMMRTAQAQGESSVVKLRSAEGG